jgi:hypothetical protein
MTNIRIAAFVNRATTCTPLAQPRMFMDASGCLPSVRITLALVVTAFFVSDAWSAELVRAKRPDGTDSPIVQKLITVKANTPIRDQPNESSKVTRIGPYNIFFHVKTDRGEVQENGFYRIVENPQDRDDAAKCSWIKAEDAQIWATRFAVKPTRVNKDITFTVNLADGGKAPYVYADPSDPNAVPGDATAYAMILDGGDDAGTDDESYNVAFCVARTDDQGTAASLNQIGEMSLEICFVLEDEEYLKNDYKNEGKEFSKYVHDLGRSWAKKAAALSASGKVPVRLGLVVFADTHPKSGIRVPEVTVPLTDNLDRWVAGLEQVTGQVIGGDYANDGLSGIATAIGTSVGWTENSAKHVVFLGNAPWQTRKLREAEELPMRHYLNWYYDRTDPIGFWKVVPGYEDNFGESTSGKSASQILNDSYAVLGKVGDELRRNRYLHCVHIGQTQEQQFGREKLDEVDKIDNDLNKILAGKTGDEVIEILLAANKTNPGIIQFCNTLWKVRMFDKYDQRAQNEFEQLARAPGKYQGYYTHMNPSGDDVDRVTRELGEKIEAAINLIADVAKGKEKEALGDRARTETEISRPVFDIVGSKLSEEEVIKKPVQVGTASLRDSGSGRTVGEKVVMVSEDELKRIGDALDAMYRTFDGKRKAAERQNTKKVLEDVQAVLASAAAGQSVAADTQLQSVITDLPLRTEALRLTAGDIAVMSTKAFDAWLGDVKLAQDQLTALLSGSDPKRWIAINGLSATKAKSEKKTKYAFLRLSDLP